MSTEVVAIIVPGLVAGGAIVATWHHHRGRLVHERELADLDNVRDVLDEAAVWLHRTSYLLDDFHGHVNVKFIQSEDGEKLVPRLRKHGRELDALYERLSIRLGREHPATVAFKAADEAVLGTWQAVQSLRGEEPADGHPSAIHHIRQLDRQKREEAAGCRVDFKAAREHFVAAAQVAAGARLPG